MTTEDCSVDAGRGVQAQGLRVELPSMRSDIASMLMPFFPEDRSQTSYSTTIDGYKVTISSDDGHTIATSSDRKILNFIAAAIAKKIRDGGTLSRDVAVEVRDVLAAVSADGVIGGSDYQRVHERLSRLMATVIETDMPIGDGIRRRRRFRWIDAFEHDDQVTPSGRKILSLNISVSKDAFDWFTRSLGFDTGAQEFQRITSGRSSIWRIYEICLATLAQAQAQANERTVAIPIAELRDRVPIVSELKVFKSRTLSKSLAAIAKSPEMSNRIAVRLERQTARGSFEPIDFKTRAPLDQIFVRVGPGRGAMPRFERLIKEDEPGLHSAAELSANDVMEAEIMS